MALTSDRLLAASQPAANPHLANRLGTSVQSRPSRSLARWEWGATLETGSGPIGGSGHRKGSLFGLCLQWSPICLLTLGISAYCCAALSVNLHPNGKGTWPGAST
jgi:hypothetical protein